MQIVQNKKLILSAKFTRTDFLYFIDFFKKYGCTAQQVKDFCEYAKAKNDAFNASIFIYETLKGKISTQEMRQLKAYFKAQGGFKHE